MSRTLPAQKPGRSVQDVGTPRDFLDAVEKRFGPICIDLAATDENKACHVFVSPYEDAFSFDWGMFSGLQWLNPPYSDIGKWAKKCAESAPAKIALLVPAAVGTNYFRDHIFNQSRVLFLSPRLTFVGHTQSYPKDLMLCMYGFEPGFECWRWKP